MDRMKMNKIRLVNDNLDSTASDTVVKDRLIFWPFTLLGILGIFLLICCGDSSKSDISKALTPHAAIKIDGGTATQSNLAITSDNTTESAVSVTNGGNLTLSDSTIYKTAPAGSMVGGPPDPNLAPDIPGPPGTPGGAPPPGEPPGGTRGTPPPGEPPGGIGGGGGDIGSRSSGVYVGSQGTATLSNITIETNLSEGKGMCVIGKGSSITLTKGTITTAGHSSHGFFVDSGGSALIKDVSITTKGEHSSVLATDMGGGTIIAEGGTYTTLGKYSSGIYSTDNISVSDAKFKSELDNAAVIEWNSKITLNNTSLWSGKKGAVMIYQSIPTTGGMSNFKMTGGDVTAEEGPVFYVTNTNASIDLKGVKLDGASGTLLEALKGDWGSDVSEAKPTRGGVVDFIADEQTLIGDIVMDKNSSITLTLKNKSSLKGAINADNEGKEMNLMLDSSSTWDVTEDSYLNTLILSYEVPGDSISNIIGNGHTVYYDKNTSSAALGGKAYDLAKGGKLQPK